MKLCSFAIASRECFGFELREGELVDLPETLEALIGQGALQASYARWLEARDLKSWLSRGKEAMEVARQVGRQLLSGVTSSGVYAENSVRFRAPIPNPGKIIAVGLNYKDHAEEQGVPLPDRPLIFAKFPTAVIGPGDEIRLPGISRQVDPEAELCVVILERGKALSEQGAPDVIAGYTVGNDVSARDLQFSDKQWVRGKSCDTFAPMGPFLVTPDEVGDPHELAIELRVNGEQRQSSHTRNLIFNSYQLVSFISQAITLEPGDIIFTGTPSGVGVFRKPPVFLQPGDRVEVTIERIGTLRNPVANFE